MKLLVIMTVILLSLYAVRVMCVEPFLSPDANGPPVAVMNLVTRPEFDLLTAPLVSTVNSVVDTINELPKKLHSSVVDMSSSIGNKIKEYGETMQTHAREPDSPESLQSITVYEANKTFIDKVRTSNVAFYDALATQAEAFYKVPFEKQDAALEKVLITLVPFKSQIASRLSLTAAN
jgi:hypothetical protein